jgi:Putative adhesin
MATADLPGDAPRPPAAIRGALKLVAWIGAAALVLWGAWQLLNLAARHTFDARAAYTAVRSLVVDDGSGEVVLSGAPAGAQLTVVEHVTENLSSPTRHAVRDSAGVLRLTAGCSTVLGTGCKVSYEIAVPAGIPVLASSGAGDVTASDLSTTASVSLSSGAGLVSATRISAPDLSLASGAGEVSAQMTQPPTRLVSRSGAGDISITVPNVTYAVHASSGAGTVSDQTLRIDPASPRRIDATSGAGDVTIAVIR